MTALRWLCSASGCCPLPDAPALKHGSCGRAKIRGALQFRCNLLARQQLADTAQGQIVAEDTKTRHRAAADTGNL
jgi:hypothetical protein